MRYYYKAFGINIESSRKISFFPQINSSSNTQLKIIEKRIISNSTYDFSDSFKETFEDECHIFLKDEIYLKISKDTITFELCSELSEIHFSKRIVNMAIPMLFVLNDFMVLHASSVNLDNHILLFSGQSGSGKSSASIDLINNKNASLITEDVAIIKNNIESLIIPSYPYINLREEKKLLNNSRGINKIDNDKKAIKIKNFFDSEIKISKCIFLEWGENFEFKKISKKDSFYRVVANMWHPYPFNKNFNQSKNQFFQVSKFVNNMEFYLLKKDYKNEEFSISSINFFD